MSTAALYQQVQQGIREARSRALRIPMLLVLLIGLPFLPPWLALLVGAGLGVPIARALARATRASRPSENPYPATLPDDTDVLRYTPIGLGMPLLDYQEGLNDYMRAHSVRERSSSVEKAYLEQAVDRMQPLFLEDEMDLRHGAIIGPTGAGKTEMILNLIESSVSRGGPVVVLNAKGDMDFLKRVHHIACEYGREDHLRIVDFDHPEISHTYNPVMGGSGVRSKVSTLMKLNNNTKEEFFRDMNRSAVVNALVALDSQPDKPGVHFGDLGVLFNDPYEFHRLFMNMPEDTLEQRQAREFVWQFLQRWVDRTRDGQVIYNEENYRKFLQGLATKMNDFAHSEYRQIACSYDPDIEMYDIITRRRILVISMPALSDKEGLKLFGQLIMADIARAIGQIQAYETQPHLPCRLIAEEYGSFKDESHQELWQLARSGQISLWLSIQAEGFLSDLTSEFAANILSNVWHIFFLGARDKQTRDLAVERGPSIVREFRQSNRSESFSSGHRSSETGGDRQENSGGSISEGSKEVREELIQPEDFEFMDMGDALLIGSKGVMRMRLPLLEFDDDAPVLERVNLPRPDAPPRPGLRLMEDAYNRDRGRRAALDEVTKERKR